MFNNQLLSRILDIGEQMLISGAEISRVEDSISRMCIAYQVKRVDVLTITSVVQVSVHLENGEVFTQSRRIRAYATNLNKLDKLNKLSRNICSSLPDLVYIDKELEEINKEQPYSQYAHYLIYALVAGSFTIFFGGNMADGLASAMIGMLLKFLVNAAQKMDKNLLMINIFCSFAVGAVAIFAVQWGFGNNLEKILIGNIMLMIPGLALTTSIRDMISGDTISGLLRFSEAILLATSIALGFGLAEILFGGRLV